MRLLWLKSDLLLPLDKGGRLRTWHLLRELARRHEITYVAFAEPGQTIDGRTLDPQLASGMRSVAARVETIARGDAPKRSLRFYLDAAAHLLDPLPYAVGKYRSRAYRQRVEALMTEHSFDLIV